jgi:hypothetical protein
MDRAGFKVDRVLDDEEHTKFDVDILRYTVSLDHV